MLFLNLFDWEELVSEVGNFENVIHFNFSH